MKIFNKGMITFSKSATDFILNTFDKAVDEKGLIIEKNKPSQRVLAPDGQEIHVSEFAGIKKGSEVFIKSDLVSLIKLFDCLRGKQG